MKRAPKPAHVVRSLPWSETSDSTQCWRRDSGELSPPRCSVSLKYLHGGVCIFDAPDEALAARSWGFQRGSAMPNRPRQPVELTDQLNHLGTKWWLACERHIKAITNSVVASDSHAGVKVNSNGRGTGLNLPWCLECWCKRTAGFLVARPMLLRRWPVCPFRRCAQCRR